jgi:hypothetical protein
VSVCCECCVLSGRGLFYELITRPEESYRLWCDVVCDLETTNTKRLKPATGLWKIQQQWVVTPGKQTNKQLSSHKAKWLLSYYDGTAVTAETLSLQRKESVKRITFTTAHACNSFNRISSQIFLPEVNNFVT